MDLLNIITHNLLSFIVILSIIVFVHEFGHYYVARLCGVKIDEFSIGFGKELYGFNDKNGTRWKFCILPFGGYVKMFGDKNPASVVDSQKIKKLTIAEKKTSFYFQNVYKRIAIVAAGPIANFILTIAIFTFMFRVQGVTTVAPIVDQVMEDGSAFASGIKSGDVIKNINDQQIEDFDDVREIVSQNGDKNLRIIIDRAGKEIIFDIIPNFRQSKDVFGNEIKIGMIGVSASEIHYEKLNLINSFIRANYESYNFSIKIFKALGELVTGKRSIKELGGPVKIAKYSGQSMSMGFMVVLWFMSMISLNLGVMNLLPLPGLDGGHLFYYIIEVIKGRPLPEKIQQYGFQFGFAVLISLMLFVTINDIYQILIR